VDADHSKYFEFTTVCDGGMCMVRMVGDLDMASQPALGSFFRAATAGAFEVDLCDLDSSTAAAIGR